MNLFGYKMKKKSIARLLNREENKPKGKQCELKIKRLERAKNNVSKTIAKLRSIPHDKRAFKRTKKSGQTCRNKPIPKWWSNV